MGDVILGINGMRTDNVALKDVVVAMKRSMGKMELLLGRRGVCMCVCMQERNLNFQLTLLTSSRSLSITAATSRRPSALLPSTLSPPLPSYEQYPPPEPPLTSPSPSVQSALALTAGSAFNTPRIFSDSRECI